jgi:hypothetical protein
MKIQILEDDAIVAEIQDDWMKGDLKYIDDAYDSISRTRDQIRSSQDLLSGVPRDARLLR